MPLNLTKRGRFWHYSGTVAGQRLRGTTGATDKTIAQRIANQVESRLWTRHLDGPGADLTFAAAAMLYREAGKSTRFLERVEDHWQNQLVRQITQQAVQQAALKLYPKAGPATRNRQVIVPTQAVINFAAESGLCDPIRVRRFKVQRKEKKPATLEWVNRFAKHASPHLGALCLFMFGTGARIGEAVAMTWADVDLDRGTAKIRQTKIGDERVAHLPEQVLWAISGIPSNRERNRLVFGYAHRENVRKSWDAAVIRAGIERLSPHSCRHGFATAMLQGGIDVKTVAKMGGWKDVATLVRTYAHAMDDITVTDTVFGKKLTQSQAKRRATL